MKYFLSVFFLTISLQTFSQQVFVKKIHNNILEYAPDYENLIKSMGENYYLNRYHEINDFNGDGNLDLFMNTIADPEKNQIRCLFINQSNNGEYKFVEDKNYRSLAIGDAGMMTNNSADFNQDGLMDIFCYTENYHGKPGMQPAGYFKDGNNTPDFYLLNNGKSWDKVLADTTVFNNDYFNQKIPIVMDLNNNGLPEVVYGNIGQLQNLFTEPEPNKKTLFLTYELAKNSKTWSRNLVMPVTDKKLEPSGSNLMSFPFRSGIFNNDFYFITHVDRNYDISTKSFTDKNPNEDVNVYSIMDLFLNKVSMEGDITKNQVYELADINTEYPFALVNDWGTWVKDLDLDGTPEIVTMEDGYNVKPNDKRPTKIGIYNLSGEDISTNWFSDSLNYDYTDSHANGMVLVDLDNDGDIDLVPQSGWVEKRNDSVGYNIFMNYNNKFNKTFVVFPDSKTSNNLFGENSTYARGGKLPVDLDKNGTYELMVIREAGNVDLIEIGYNDLDGDGILDLNDKCENTPYGTKVDANGCELVLSTYLLDKKFSVSPNPFEHSIKIEFPEDFGPLVGAKIHDINGVKVWEKETVKNSEILDLSKLPKGNYVLNLTSVSNGQIKTIKIQKQGN